KALESGGYPYDSRMKRKKYERKLRLLQIELLKMQAWSQDTGQRIVILFEGRDAAGKGGTIKRFMEHLNPRHARAVALPKPTEAERGQWYFQRYAAQLPTAGDMLLFDRSWYNRAGVERVMGFCTPEQVEKFYGEAPAFEAALVRDDIKLFKLWLTIGREMQLKRLHARRQDPLKRWKLTDIDLAAISHWEDYSQARDDMFRRTHRELTPWTVIRANDKRRTRVGAIRHVLSHLNYTGKDEEAVGKPDPKIVGNDDDFFLSA
ncbi:MAG: polyphosphate kinase 2, partial [Pseudomonadota bacterium]|nr:polyphosphate kinase 2 [Pseudomonadota bacterium]